MEVGLEQLDVRTYVTRTLARTVVRDCVSRRSSVVLRFQTLDGKCTGNLRLAVLPSRIATAELSVRVRRRAGLERCKNRPARSDVLRAG